VRPEQQGSAAISTLRDYSHMHRKSLTQLKTCGIMAFLGMTWIRQGKRSWRSTPRGPRPRKSRSKNVTANDETFALAA